jgi:hypothetical protein
MKTIVAGSRSITDYEIVQRAMELAPWPITEVKSGTAPGVDRLGEHWAGEHSVPVKEFPAKCGKRSKYNVQAVSCATNKWLSTGTR